WTRAERVLAQRRGELLVPGVDLPGRRVGSAVLRFDCRLVPERPGSQALRRSHRVVACRAPPPPLCWGSIQCEKRNVDSLRIRPAATGRALRAAPLELRCSLEPSVRLCWA